jgi:hypothetical protein
MSKASALKITTVALRPRDDVVGRTPLDESIVRPSRPYQITSTSWAVSDERFDSSLAAGGAGVVTARLKNADNSRARYLYRLIENR